MSRAGKKREEQKAADGQRRAGELEGAIDSTRRKLRAAEDAFEHAPSFERAALVAIRRARYYRAIAEHARATGDHGVAIQYDKISQANLDAFTRAQRHVAKDQYAALIALMEQQERARETLAATGT